MGRRRRPPPPDVPRAAHASRECVYESQLDACAVMTCIFYIVCWFDRGEGGGSRAHSSASQGETDTSNTRDARSFGLLRRRPSPCRGRRAARANEESVTQGKSAKRGSRGFITRLAHAKSGFLGAPPSSAFFRCCPFAVLHELDTPLHVVPLRSDEPFCRRYIHPSAVDLATAVHPPSCL